MEGQGTVQSRLSRRAFLQALVVGGNAVALGACQVPTTPPASSRSANRGMPRGASGPAPGAAGAAAWEPAWRELVEAARREGNLVVGGPPTPAVRTELPAAFRSRFGIEMEYLGGNTSELLTRLEAERQSGQYTLDAILGGAQTLYTRAYPAKLLDPIPPVLIHPEATDPARWIAGRLWFMDPEQQYVLRLSNQVGTGVTVNAQYVRPDEIQSWYDLLDPRYRGKISVYDPLSRDKAGRSRPTCCACWARTTSRRYIWTSNPA